MPDIKDTSRAQTLFLRAVSKDPFGMSGRAWPKPTTFRRWMRRPGFRVAMQQLRDSMRLLADVQLAAAVAAAANGVAKTIITEDGTVCDEYSINGARLAIDSFAKLMRLSHVRQRFGPPDPKEKRRFLLSPDVQYTIDRLREITVQGARNELTVGEARELIWHLDHPDGEEPEDRNIGTGWVEKKEK
jgi:hypothetical protein